MTPLTSWRNAVFAAFFLMGFGFASWMARVPHVRDVLGASTGDMGILLLGISIGSVSGLLAASHVVHWLGSARVTAYGMTLVATGLAIAGWAAEAGLVPLIVVGFVAGGLMTGVTDVAMNISGAANERAMGTPIMPVFHAFFSVGTVAGAGLGALSEWLDVPLGWQATGVAIATGATGLMIRRFLHEDAALDDEAPVTWRERVAVWKEPTTLMLGLMVLGMALTEGSANDWLALLMVDGHGFTKAGGALVFAAFLAAMTAGRLVGVPLLERFGRVVVLRATAVLAAVGLLLVILVDNQAVSIIGTILWGIGASLGFPVGMSAAADDPRLGTARVGTVSTIGYLAFLAGPPLLGILGEHFTLRLAMLAVLAFVLLSLVTSGVARERTGRFARTASEVGA